MVRGSPWNEVIFLVSEGGSVNNAVLVWNTRLEAWSIFPKSSVTGKLSFACGTNWRDSSLLERTLLGGYDGYVYEAFGTADTNSGLDDDGAPIETEFRHGYLDFDYPGVTAVRNLYVEGEIDEDKVFDVQFETGGASPSKTVQITFAPGGHLLGDFMLDVDYLSDPTFVTAKCKVDRSGRLLQARILRSNMDNPHIFTGLNYTVLHQGMRMQ